MDDEQWRRIAEEFRRREVPSFTHALTAAGVDVRWVDAALENRMSGHQLHDAAVASWRQAGLTGEPALLLAVYVYIQAQRAWELSINHEPIQRTIRAALASWLSLSPPDDQDALAVKLMLRHAASTGHCMDAETALNCSCPVYLEDQAKQVVSENRELLDLSEKLPERLGGFRRAFLDYVLRAHVANYSALTKVGEAVLAWIMQGRAAAPAVEEAISFLREQEMDPAVRGDVYESELRSHRHTLMAIADRIADPSIPAVVLDEAMVTYCYPFALHGMSPGEAMERAGGKLGADDLDLSDLWSWGRTRDALYECVSIPFPDLTVHTTAGERLTGHEVEVRLSKLGNHAVYIRRRFGGGTPHDIHQSLRRASQQMGKERITVDAESPLMTAWLAPGEPPLAGVWPRLPAFATELVTRLTALLRAGSSEDAEPVMDAAVQFHVYLEVRSLSVHGDDGSVTPGESGDLVAAAGPLLLHPVRPNATALEEWVRNAPVEPRKLLGDVGFAGDLAVRTANTSVLVMPATPNWVLLAYAEMIDFVASLPALFSSWVQLLEAQVASLDLARMDEFTLAEGRIELHRAIQAVRGQLAILHSPELVETSSYRAFLDRLYEASGLLRLQDQLLAAIHQAEAVHTTLSGYISVREKQRDTGYQQRVQLVLMAISFFSIADLLTFTNGLFPWIPHDPAALTTELLCSGGLAVGMSVVIYKPAQDLMTRLAHAIRRRRRRRRAA